MSKQDSPEKTAIIKKLVIGRVDHYKDIMASATMDMNGLGCVLTFSMEELKSMMDDAKVYDNCQSLVGKPCQILAEWGKTCKFLGMWKA